VKRRFHFWIFVSLCRLFSGSGNVPPSAASACEELCNLRNCTGWHGCATDSEQQTTKQQFY